MGEYNYKWFSFEVKSKRHIMDLTIEPSFAKAVCFQVHEMSENFFQLFWNLDMKGHEVMALFKKFAEINNVAATMENYFSEKFDAFMRLNTTPISIVDLDADDMSLVNDIINANWQYEEFRCGLDGHSYNIKIYGEQVSEFECWCVIPEAWIELVPLVDRLIDIAKLEPRNCYAVHSVRRANGVDKTLLTPPPSNSEGMTLEIPEFFWSKSHSNPNG